jgi:hypothetical protein
MIGEEIRKNKEFSEKTGFFSYLFPYPEYPVKFFLKENWR